MVIWIALGAIARNVADERAEMRIVVDTIGNKYTNVANSNRHRHRDRCEVDHREDAKRERRRIRSRRGRFAGDGRRWQTDLRRCSGRRSRTHVRPLVEGDWGTAMTSSSDSSSARTRSGCWRCWVLDRQIVPFGNIYRLGAPWRTSIRRQGRLLTTCARPASASSRRTAVSLWQ